MHPVDIFVKNTHEVLGPLHELTAYNRLTAFEYVTEDRNVRRATYGEGSQAVKVTVNLGQTPAEITSKTGGRTILPPWGFLVESPRFVAFHARSWKGQDYGNGALFTLRPTDNKDLKDSSSIRVALLSACRPDAAPHDPRRVPFAGSHEGPDRLPHEPPHSRGPTRFDPCPEEYGRILGQAASGELKILMISVERFRNERFRSHFRRMNASLLVIDEAHCISEWGHNFRPEYLKLPAYRKEFAIPQVLLLTATATEPVIQDMCVKFDVPRANVTVTGFYRSNLFLQVTPVCESRKQAHLLQRIRESPKSPTLVYVTLQKTAEQVSDFLRTSGVVSCAYHAGMEAPERERIQNEFLGGRVDCVVATIAFGMGIDKRDIRRVIHYDLPKSIESYSQEIGRSGRDGQPAFCEVLANRDNLGVLENFVYGDTPDPRAVDKLLGTIRQQTDRTWETRLIGLSYDLDIRVLPLKTLLVYLDMEGDHQAQVHPLRRIRVQVSDAPSRSSRHSKGRDGSSSGRSPGVPHQEDLDLRGRAGIFGGYDKADRARVIAALEYFSEKRWIELQAKQEVEAYEVLARDFDVATLSRKLCGLFAARENHEIQRIHAMLDFFESDACLEPGGSRLFGDESGRTAAAIVRSARPVGSRLPRR